VKHFTYWTARSSTAALLLVVLCARSGAVDQQPGITTVWSESPTPQITYGQTLASMVWNDPCVVKEGAGYRMWLSGGIIPPPPLPPGPVNPIVCVYEATSPDGIAWTINPSPEVSNGAANQWDSQRIETPVVVKAGATYHMYYSGGTAAEMAAGQYHIGHATSPDGSTWTKDPANPIINYTADPNHWGFYTTAEPGVVYDPTTDIFYLYYTTIKARPGYSGDLGAMYGICLATSTDGSSFTHYDADGDGFDDAVLQQTAAYPVSGDYVGYSTPTGLIDAAHVFHLFYDVVQYPDPSDFRQVAVAHATSTDGKHFTEIETNILTNGGGSWHSWEVRSPSVIQEGTSFTMWFAGTGGNDDWTTTGIARAVGAQAFPSPPLITSPTVATATVGGAFSYLITATNAPTTFAAMPLPAGLTIAPTTGQISGVATIAGTTAVTLSATNAGGVGTALLTVTTTAATPVPVITSALTASATVGSTVTYQITATGNPTAYGATGLPAGLTVNTASGLISGAASATGAYAVTISATNAAGTGSAAWALTINAIPIAGGSGTGSTDGTTTGMSIGAPGNSSSSGCGFGAGLGVMAVGILTLARRRKRRS
jgi:hypothetical protein